MASRARPAAFVQRIVGSHPSVMGLPVYEAVQLLHGVGWRA
jgi:septum formation protein